jgi:carbonic anhydrase
VLPKTIKMSKAQIDAFKHLFEEGNSRPTQPLNSRTIARVRH